MSVALRVLVAVVVAVVVLAEEVVLAHALLSNDTCDIHGQICL